MKNEQADARRDGPTYLARPKSQAVVVTNGYGEKIFPCSPEDLTLLIHTLLITYIWCMYVWSSHIAEYGSTGKVANPTRG